MTPFASCCRVISSVFGKAVPQEESLQAITSLEQHIVHVLGAEALDRWTVEVRLSATIYRYDGT